MTIEEALIDLGDRPLSKSPYQRVIIAIANTYLTRSQMITRDTQGDEALSRIYQFVADEQREELLGKSMGHVRNRDSYKPIVLAAAGLIGAAMIVLALVTMSQAGAGNAQPGVDAINNIVNQSFEIIKALLGIK